MTAADLCGVLLLAAVATPLVAYLAAKLAGYGWLKGQWQFLQEKMSQQPEEEDSGNEKRT